MELMSGWAHTIRVTSSLQPAASGTNTSARPNRQLPHSTAIDRFHSLLSPSPRFSLPAGWLQCSPYLSQKSRAITGNHWQSRRCSTSFDGLK